MSIKASRPATDEKLDTMRHSASHIMAEAVKSLFPETKFGIGPAIENGFYYDFELPRTLVPEDLPIIEAKMKEIGVGCQ
jgi:threonyl-tRNA synthetase